MVTRAAAALLAALSAVSVACQELGYLSTSYAEVRWTYALGGQSRMQPVLSADGATVYSCYNGPHVNDFGVQKLTGFLVALDALNGAARWTFRNPDRQPFSESSRCPVILDDGVLMVVSNHFDPRSGRILFVDSATGEQISDGGGPCSPQGGARAVPESRR